LLLAFLIIRQENMAESLLEIAESSRATA